MDETQTPPEVKELQAECQWLRRQIQIILILLILVSATVTFFLQRQVKYHSADLSGARTMIDNYSKSEGAVTEDLIKKLADYGRTHPDFAAIYNKYGLNQVGQAPTSGVAAPKK